MNLKQKVINKLNEDKTFKKVDSITNRELRALIDVLEGELNEWRQQRNFREDSINRS